MFRTRIHRGFRLLWDRRLLADAKHDLNKHLVRRRIARQTRRRVSFRFRFLLLFLSVREVCWLLSSKHANLTALLVRTTRCRRKRVKKGVAFQKELVDRSTIPSRIMRQGATKSAGVLDARPTSHVPLDVKTTLAVSSQLPERDPLSLSLSGKKALNAYGWKQIRNCSRARARSSSSSQQHDPSIRIQFALTDAPSRLQHLTRHQYFL